MATIRTNPYIITFSRIGGTFMGGAIVTALTKNKMLAAPVMAVLFIKTIYEHKMMTDKFDLLEDMQSDIKEDIIGPKKILKLVAISATEVGIGCFAASRFVVEREEKERHPQPVSEAQ